LLRAEDPAALAAALRKEFEKLDASIPVRFHPMSVSYAGALARPRFGALLITFFAVCATLLAALGLFSSMAYAVRRRTRELGVRLALGARPGDVQRQVLREALVSAAIGGVLGCGLAALAARLLETELFGVSAADPAAFAGSATILFVTALAAAWAPARFASRIDPMEALRQD
jgi:ABC-type antimicrobial peptide transport system permease subunit